MLFLFVFLLLFFPSRSHRETDVTLNEEPEGLTLMLVGLKRRYNLVWLLKSPTTSPESLDFVAVEHRRVKTGQSARQTEKEQQSWDVRLAGTRTTHDSHQEDKNIFQRDSCQKIFESSVCCQSRVHGSKLHHGEVTAVNDCFAKDKQTSTIWVCFTSNKVSECLEARISNSWKSECRTDSGDCFNLVRPAVTLQKEGDWLMLSKT